MTYFAGNNEEGMEVFTGNGPVPKFDNEESYKVAIPRAREQRDITSEGSPGYVQLEILYCATHLQVFQHS
jgi:hypothetical protein